MMPRRKLVRREGVVDVYVVVLSIWLILHKSFGSEWNECLLPSLIQSTEVTRVAFLDLVGLMKCDYNVVV